MCMAPDRMTFREVHEKKGDGVIQKSGNARCKRGMGGGCVCPTIS